jgi:hypothetical protein
MATTTKNFKVIKSGELNIDFSVLCFVLFLVLFVVYIYFSLSLSQVVLKAVVEVYQ